MKRIFVLLVFVLILPSILAISIDVEKQSSGEVLIKELDTPAVFDLRITNWGVSDNFKLYNLVGFLMSPDVVSINQGEAKDVKLMIFPAGELRDKGYYTFKYTIRGQDKTESDQKLTVNIIDLKDAFEVGADEFDSGASSLNVFIHNKVNFNFDKIDAEFKSPFFNFKESFSLSPNEKKSFEIKLNKEEFKQLMAGYYTLNAKLLVQDKSANVEGKIRFVEKNLVTTAEDNSGFIIFTKTIEKINEGNVLVNSETVIKKNLISRLFTSFNIAPDVVESQGFFVYYTWNNEIKPGEDLKIVSRTNWLFPLLVILFVVSIVALTKKYSKTDMVLNKKVSFVKAKGGEFALKISIIVNAKKYVEKIKVSDRLPPLVKIHENFGGDLPKRIHETKKMIEWEFEKLEPGERRVISYIIYSKVGILGRFALPTASAIYERDGKVHEVQSNKAFFIAEQGKKLED